MRGVETAAVSAWLFCTYDTHRTCSLWFYLVGRGLVSAVTHAVLTSGRWLRTTCSLLMYHLQQQEDKGAVVGSWSHGPNSTTAADKWCIGLLRK